MSRSAAADDAATEVVAPATSGTPDGLYDGLRDSSGSAAKDLGRMGSWRSIVLTRINSLQCEVEALGARTDPPVDPGALRGVRFMLDAAGAATQARRRRLRSWWNGAWVERAWRCVHEAEAQLAALSPVGLLRVGYPDLLASARHLFSGRDPRLEAIKQLAQAPDKGKDKGAEDLEREQYVAALRWTHSKSDNAHARVRSFRNVVAVATLALTLVAIALVLVGMRNPEAWPVCVEPTTTGDVVVQPTTELICPTGRDEPTSGDVLLVGFVGLVGASLAAALAIRKLRGTSTPYGVPLALALLKLPTGAITALAGLLLIEGGFLPGLSALDDPAQVLSYSLILGFAQEAFTRLADRQGQIVLESAPGRDRLAAEPADGVGVDPSDPPTLPAVG